MRRTDREILERERIDSIIRRCGVCRLGVVSEGEPYVVPLSFGYDGSAVYLHMAGSGRKLDALRTGQQVCLEWDLPGRVQRGEDACAWGQAYESVIAYGRPEIVEDQAGRRRGLELLMSHYAGEPQTGSWDMRESVLARTVVVRVVLDRVSGKARDPEPGR
ncbi:MAG: pyridoxamine 5'-phosphate oxidase family protein [Chloroflexi bacterium]|nr:pyridoxamine 5'-phosphate oxidase family protein [Chloroflexota bacterium]